MNKIRKIKTEKFKNESAFNKIRNKKIEMEVYIIWE